MPSREIKAVHGVLFETNFDFRPPNRTGDKARNDLARIIFNSCEKEGIHFLENDIIVITSKIVSKAENSLVDITEIVPSRRSKAIARLTGEDSVEVEIILRDTKEITAVIPIKKVMDHYPAILESLSIDQDADCESSSESSGDAVDSHKSRTTCYRCRP